MPLKKHEEEIDRRDLWLTLPPRFCPRCCFPPPGEMSPTPLMWPKQKCFCFAISHFCEYTGILAVGVSHRHVTRKTLPSVTDSVQSIGPVPSHPLDRYFHVNSSCNYMYSSPGIETLHSHRNAASRIQQTSNAHVQK